MRLKNGTTVIEFKKMELKRTVLEFYGESEILPVHKIDLGEGVIKLAGHILEEVSNKLLLRGYVDVSEDIMNPLKSLEV